MIPVPVTELLGEGALVVEQQTLFPPVGDSVQAEAYFPEEMLSVNQGTVFTRGERTFPDQVFQTAEAEVAFHDPADHLGIAQAAGAFLDVGFEVVDRIVKAFVALLLLGQLGGKKILAGPDMVRTNAGPHLLEQRFGAAQQPRFHQVGGNGNVRLRLFPALAQGAYAVPDFQANIPQQHQKGFQFLSGCRVFRFCQQQHDVDI